MSDTDSIVTDRSQSDLQHKYDRLAMEFAKTRMQLNVLKKAYTAKTSQLNQRSVESLDQFENCKYDSISTRSLDLQDDFNKPSEENAKVNLAEELKSQDVKLLRQEINAMNHYICRVLESTKSNTFDYNHLMAEIDNCKNLQNNRSSDFCKTLNNDLATLKCSVTTCLYNILYHKLESRTKINSEDSCLIFPENGCIDNGYKSECRFNNVHLALVLHFLLSLVLNVHGVLECLMKGICPDAFLILKRNLNALTNQTLSNSVILETISTYCDDLKTFKVDSKNISIENILLFVSHKYVEIVNCLKNCMTSENIEEIECSKLRGSIISFMALKFPISELVETSESQISDNISIEFNGVISTIHTLLRVINLWEFENVYKRCQLGMHWHMKNSLLNLHTSSQAKAELKSMSVSESSFEKTINLYKNKLNQEMNRSLSLEQEKMHWENEFKILTKKNEGIIGSDINNGSSETAVLENQLGKCESRMNLNDGAISREKELKRYFETKINDLISTKKELSSRSNAHEIEIVALRTQLDQSVLVRNKLEAKLKEALEYIEDLKDEFNLTSTNYENQLRAMSEHLASLNETVELERKHIDDLNKGAKQLKTKDKKQSSK